MELGGSLVRVFWHEYPPNCKPNISSLQHRCLRQVSRLFEAGAPILPARDCSFGSTALAPTNANLSVPTKLLRALVRHFRSTRLPPTFGPPGLVLSEAA